MISETSWQVPGSRVFGFSWMIYRDSTVRPSWRSWCLKLLGSPKTGGVWSRGLGFSKGSQWSSWYPWMIVQGCPRFRARCSDESRWLIWGCSLEHWPSRNRYFSGHHPVSPVLATTINLCQLWFCIDSTATYFQLFFCNSIDSTATHFILVWYSLFFPYVVDPLTNPIITHQPSLFYIIIVRDC